MKYITFSTRDRGLTETTEHNRRSRLSDTATTGGLSGVEAGGHACHGSERGHRLWE